MTREEEAVKVVLLSSLFLSLSVCLFLKVTVRLRSSCGDFNLNKSANNGTLFPHFFCFSPSIWVQPVYTGKEKREQNEKLGSLGPG